MKIDEEQIEEIMLEPITEEEENAELTNYSDSQIESPDLKRTADAQMKKDNYVVYLESDDIKGLTMDQHELDMANFAKQTSFKGPKPNMLSEISEEDDVSMVSERTGKVSTGKRTHKNSSKQSQQMQKA